MYSSTADCRADVGKQRDWRGGVLEGEVRGGRKWRLSGVELREGGHTQVGG